MMKTLRKLLIFLLILVVGLGGYVTASWIINKQPPELLKMLVPAQTKTIAVMGMDAAGLRSDVLMVVFLNGETGNVDILSVPRDTRVLIGSRYHKINSAYAIGEHEQTVQTLEELLNIKIDNYVKFSFETFRNIIDALGGVDFDVPQDMFYEDPYQDLYIDLSAGMQHLDGEKAEQLVRYRQYPTGDEGRIAVQQDFIRALVQQKLSIKTLFKIPEVIRVIKETIDTDIPEENFMPLASIVLKMNSDSLSTHKLPGGAKRIAGLSYYIADENETEKLIAEITD